MRLSPSTARPASFSNRWDFPGTLLRLQPRREPRAPSPVLQNMSFDVERHVLASIAAAPILREPFAHCVIDGIFPPKFFEDILDHWPEETSWQPLGESGRVTDRAYGERRVVLMNDAGLARLDEP